MMGLRERRYNVLVVSSSEKFNTGVTAMLPEGTYAPAAVVNSADAARRQLLERQYDFVLINAPLPDDFGSRLAMDICSSSSAVAVLFVRNEMFEQVYDRVVDFGVVTLAKPTTPPTVLRALQLLCATRERLRRMEKKTASVEEKMQEIRLVNRAKWILIAEMKMTEEEAHRYIEKQAMDQCCPKREIAAGIIRTYQ